MNDLDAVYRYISEELFTERATKELLDRMIVCVPGTVLHANST